MIDIHVVYAAHVGPSLGYQEITRVFLINQNCHRVTERLYEAAVKYAPGTITCLSMDLLVITPDEARQCLSNPLLTPFFLTHAERPFITYREAIINYQTTFQDENVLNNFIINESKDDEMISIYLLVIPLWVPRPTETLISHLPTMKLSVHVFNGLRCDYKKLALSLDAGDNYGLFIQKLYQRLINELSMSRWTGHVRKNGMIEFHSRPALFIIPNDMITESDFDIINLLTQGIYDVDVRKVLYSLDWGNVHRYVSVKDVLKNTVNVDIVACLSGEPRNDYRSNATYRDHTAMALYWADIDYNKLKMIMADDLRRRINDLLDVEQAVISLNQFIHAPKQSADDDADFVADDILRTLRKKCVEELEMRERFNDP
jgi:hypothetical protein